jgi:hypothetical protein
VALSTLIVVVLSHIAVFWVVRNMYPPSPPVVQMQIQPQPQPVFTPPPVLEQHVTLPTYEAPVSAQAPSEKREGPPPAESTSIRRDPGVDMPNPQ